MKGPVGFAMPPSAPTMPGIGGLHVPRCLGRKGDTGCKWRKPPSGPGMKQAMVQGRRHAVAAQHTVAVNPA